MENKTKVIYIAGTHRGGSTLLDMILSTDKRAFSVGELKYLKVIEKKQNRYCDCGKILKECPYWRRVRKQLNEQDFFRRKPQIRDYLKSLKSIFLKSWVNKNTNNDKIYQILQNEAENITNKKIEYIIDSSKTIERLTNLKGMPNVELYIIHLIRDFRGIGYSNKKRGNNPIIKAITGRMMHETIRKFYKKNLNKNHVMTLTYEELTSDPKKAINKLNSFFGLNIDANNLIKNINNQTRHSFAGSNFRNRKLKNIKRDKEWEKNLSKIEKKVLKRLNVPA